MNLSFTRSRWFPWALAALLVAIAAAVYARVVGFDFVMWDDDRMLYLNSHVQGLTALNLHWMFTDAIYNRLYMPLGWLDYAISFSLFGLEPSRHHAINLGLHLVNTLLVFAVLKELLRVALPLPKNGDAAAARGAATAAAFVGALFWAVHPLRVEVVAWVGARVHSFAAVFVLAAIWMYLRGVGGRTGLAFRRGWYWGSVILFGISLLAFPIAVTLPAAFLVLDIYVLRRMPAQRGWGAGKIMQFVLEKIPFAVVAAWPLYMSTWGRAHSPLTGPAPTLAQFGIFDRIMQACYVWMHYLVATILPTDLSPVYTTLVNFMPADPVFLASCGGLILLTAAGFYFRRQFPALWAGWLCYLILLIPFLGLSEHPHYASDRYSYLASICFSALAAAGVWRLLQMKGQRAGQARIGVAACGVVLAAFAFLASQQATIFTNTETMFRYMIAQLGDDPYRSDIYGRLATYYLQHNRPDDALGSVREMLRVADAVRKQQQPPEEIAAQYGRVQRFIGMGPNPQALIIVGDAYADAGDPGTAIGLFQEALRLAPTDPQLRLKLGAAYLRTGNREQAKAELDEAVSLDPDLAARRDQILSGGAAAPASRPPAG